MAEKKAVSRAPLRIYVLWHKDYAEGQGYADKIYAAFTRDVTTPLSRGIGIPVYFRYEVDNGDKPIDIDFSSTENTAIIILVDANIVVSDKWQEYIVSLRGKMANLNGRHRIYPVAIRKNALNLRQLNGLNFIRLYDYEEDVKSLRLINIISHELCRLLYNLPPIDNRQTQPETSPAPLKIFISHAKIDGREMAENIRDYIAKNASVKTFFDTNDIAIGYDFAHEIESAIDDNTVLLALHTDKYTSSEWCKTEITIAKRKKRPIVVVSLYEKGEERSFPFMSNVKVFKYQSSKNDLEDIIGVALKETLKVKYQEMYIKYLLSINTMKGYTVLSSPPEPLTFLFLKKVKPSCIIYPDPPFCKAELELMYEFNNEYRFVTPTFISLIKEKGEQNGII
ncbi:Toll-Interleukin receptor domain protein [Candidatus Magnetobacterium bavaricum]|uniref:Toll-Interleukin receptor domain protein n=1 Tax=Candidatus Magnetobacterium bavaricum TaxID=29290 RepID=A0A0F3GT62_9BACT|nr:Toll-Interleukin receptor domain protein [Candidatus Magnetobacterium bavaricum]